MSVLLVLVVSALALSGCSDAPEDVLIFGRGSDSIGLDPALENDGESFKVCDNIYETLVQYAAENTSVKPLLAKSWEVSSDRQVWTFHLRTDVRFHDGTPFNAAAMKFSLERLFSVDHPYHHVEGAFKYWKDMGMNDIVAHIDAPDDSTLVIFLHQPNAPFLSNLAMNFTAAVSPSALRKYGDDFFKNPVGTGPFRFVEWRKDERIVMERNPEYWGHTPKIRRLIFKPIHDASVRYLELKTGAIHGLDNISPEFIDDIRDNPELRLLEQPGMNTGYLAMNMERPPFDDRLVRLAVNHAIDKRSLVENFYQGLATPAKNPIPPTIWGYNDKVKPYPYNPAKARQLLAQAGFEKGFDTELWTMPVPRPYMPQPGKIAQALQADLSEVGIRCKIVQWEWGTYLDKVFAGEHTMALLGWTGDNGDPDNFLYVLLDKTAAEKPAQNIAFYRSDELHEILVRARRLSSQSEREFLYHRAQELVHHDVPWVPLVHATQTAAFQQDVIGFSLHPTGSKWFHNVRFVR